MRLSAGKNDARRDPQSPHHPTTRKISGRWGARFRPGDLSYKMWRRRPARPKLSRAGRGMA